MNAGLRRVTGFGERSADWKSAIQQVGNLRYEPAARWGSAPYPVAAGEDARAPKALDGARRTRTMLRRESCCFAKKVCFRTVGGQLGGHGRAGADAPIAGGAGDRR